MTKEEIVKIINDFFNGTLENVNVDWLYTTFTNSFYNNVKIALIDDKKKNLFYYIIYYKGVENRHIVIDEQRKETFLPEEHEIEEAWTDFQYFLK